MRGLEKSIRDLTWEPRRQGDRKREPRPHRGAINPGVLSNPEP